MLKTETMRLFTTSENVNGRVSGGGVPLGQDEARVTVREGNGVASPDVSASHAETMFIDVLGFDECVDLDTMTSRGDWGFALRDGQVWRAASQHNLFPYRGFEYRVNMQLDFESKESAEYFYFNA